MAQEVQPILTGPSTRTYGRMANELNALVYRPGKTMGVRGVTVRSELSSNEKS